MASIASVLQILVQANSDDATRKLRQFDDKMAKSRAEASKKIEAQLGANFDRRAFDEYEARLKATQDKVRNRAAFKAALGADFNPAAFNAYQRAMAKSESDTRRMSGSLGALERQFTGARGKVSDFNGSMMMLRNVVGLVKWPALIAGAGIATQAIGALGAGAIGLVAALAPLAGAGAAAAAGYVAFGQAMGVAKLATHGLQQALAGNKKALADLTPAQRGLLTDLKAVKTQIKSLQDTAAAGMAPGLQKGLHAVTPLFGVLRPIVGATAKEMGNLAFQAGKSVSTWGKDLTTIGKTNVTVIHNLGGAAIMLGGAFKNIVVAAGPLLTWMSELVKTGASWVQQQVYAGRESGRLTLFLGKTEEVMRLLIDTAINLGASFFNIGKAAAPLGTDLLQSLEKLTIKMREWTSSAQGQEKLRTYFDNMKAPLYAIFGLVGDIGKALIKLSGAPGLTHVVDKLRELVPVLSGVVGSTTTAFSGPFIDALTNIVKLFGDLAGTSGPLTLLVKAIGWVAGAIHSLMQSSPGMHSFVIDMVGGAAAIKALSFLPKLPVIGSLIGLFTAAAKARSLKDILGLAGLGGGKGILGGAGKSVVATMEVGTLIAKTTVGGGGGVGIPGGVAGTSEEAAASAGILSKLRAGLGGVVMGALRGAAIAGIGTLLAQAIGGSIHGSVGKAISTIGTDASIGAGFGAMFGPEGALGGAMVGGLIGAFQQFVKKVPTLTPGPYQTPAAHSVARTTTLGPTVVRGPGGQVIPQAAPVSRGSGSVGGLSPQAGRGNAPFQFPTASVEQVNKDFNQTIGLLAKLEQHQAGIKATASAFDDLAQKARKAGDIKWALADTLGSELLRTHNVASQGVMQLIAQLNRLAPGARQSAQRAMVQMTQMLETQGRLPVGSTTRMVNEMLRHYSSLRDQGGQDFRGLLNVASQQMQHLQQVAATTTGQAHAEAVRQMNALRSGVTAALTGAERNTETQVNKMAGKIQSGSRSAANTGRSNFLSFARSVEGAMNGGVVATQTGMQMIAQALNATLKAFGVAPLSNAAIAIQTGKGQLSNAVSEALAGVNEAGIVAPHAVGGFVGRPGERGRDEVHAVLGRGEAVLNHHQQQVANQYLSPIGGLPGLFSATRGTMHHLASGGFAGGASPLARMVAEADAINAKQYPYVWGGGHNASFSGPYDCSGAVSAVLHAGGLLPLPEVSGQLASYGAPGPGVVTIYANPTHTFMSIDGRFFGTHGAEGAGWYAGSALPGFTVRHAPLGPGGSTPGLIVAPTVKGAGTLAKISRAALGKATSAANQKLQSVIAASIGGGQIGGGDIGTFGSGSVQREVFQFFSATGLNRTAIAGLLGNAAQESNMNPSTPGGGLWQMISTFGSGAPTLGVQMQSLLSQIKGTAIWTMLNAAASPADAATIFMDMFEKPAAATANLPRRISAANSAFAAGFAKGGLVPYGGAFKYGGMVPGAAGEPRMILAHGGEVVLPRFAPGGVVSHGRSSTPGALGVRHSGVISHGRSSTPGALGVHHHIAPHHIAPHTVAWQHALLGEPGPIGIPGKVPSTVFGAGQVQGKITDLRNQVSVLENQYGTLDQFYNITQLNLTDPTTGEVDQNAVQTRLGQLDRLIGIRKQIFELWRRIVAWTDRLVKANSLILANLKSQLAKIRGKKLKGNAGQTQQSIDQIRGNLAQAQGDLVSGSNDRDSAWVQLLQLQSDRAGVAGTQAAASAAAAPLTDTPVTDAATIALLQQQLLQSQQTLLVSQAQYKVLSNMPPYGGSFAEGGIVPGPAGAPRTIIAHGGEPVGMAPQVNVDIHIAPGYEFLRDAIQVEISQAGRGTSRTAMRQLPGGR